MVNPQDTAEVLNDLIAINNDRIAGYSRAIQELPAVDVDMKALFSDLIDQSQGLKAELQREVAALGEEAETRSTVSGKIYRAWMAVKTMFTGKDRKAVLESCEFGEDAAQKAYRSAEMEEDIMPAAKTLISKQQLELKSSHDRIKRLRDSQLA